MKREKEKNKEDTASEEGFGKKRKTGCFSDYRLMENLEGKELTNIVFVLE